MKSSILENKRHVIVMNVGDKEITVGTDSDEFLLKHMNMQPQGSRVIKSKEYDLPPAISEPDERVDLLIEDQEHIQRSILKLADLVGELRDEVKKGKESPERQPVHPLTRPSPTPEAPADPPSSFLDVLPNQMNSDLWSGLSPEQQQQYQQKYGLAQ